MDQSGLLKRLDERWQTFLRSLEGLPERAVLEAGVMGPWSVKDLIGHIATWEEESIKVLPIVLRGRRPPRYGDIDAFNARESARKRRLPLEEIRRQLVETHARLLTFLATIAEAQFVGETRFRKRLRLDTYGHYGEHAAQIAAWRKVKGM